MATRACPNCRGVKTVIGMGGMRRACKPCDGSGLVEAPEVLASQPVLVQEINVPPKLDVIPTAEVVVSSVEAPKDLILEAILAEPSMKPDEWRAKYRAVPGLFVASPNGMLGEAISKVERANRRNLYASSQVIAPRKVDLGAQQDVAAGADLNYKAYKAREDAKLKKGKK